MPKKEPYRFSRLAFWKIIKKAFPKAQPKEGLEDIPSNLLWMLERIKEITDDPGKAGRWLGYVIGRAEALGLLNNQQSRDIVRKDIKE